jgi:hypothetical protein
VAIVAGRPANVASGKQARPAHVKRPKPEPSAID